MKIPEKLFSRTILASLPFLIYTFWLYEAVGVALLTVLVFWGTVFFFWYTRRFFPGRFLKAAFLLWLLAWAQALWTLAHLSPFWILSVFLLVPGSFLEQNTKISRVPVFSTAVKKYFLERTINGIGFLILTTLVALLHGFLGHQLQIRIFQTPVGALFLLFAISWAWKNQPAKGA